MQAAGSRNTWCERGSLTSSERFIYSACQLIKITLGTELPDPRMNVI
jgi:hypothetical protein